jgi:hypothetical protein
MPRKVQPGTVVWHVTGLNRGVIVEVKPKKDRYGRDLVIRWGDGYSSLHAYGNGSDAVLGSADAVRAGLFERKLMSPTGRIRFS